MPGLGDGGERRGVTAAQPHARPERRPQERGRLVPVDVLERLGRDRLAFRFDVHDLAAHHPVGTGRLRDGGDDVADDPCVRHQRRVLGDQPERQRQKGVAGEDRDRVAEHLVVRQPSPAVVVVVHRRQIVVDQRIGVDHLERARRGHHRRRRGADGLGPRDHEDRPQPLAARQHAVAHRAMHGRRRSVLARQEPLERRVDQRAPVF